jgi:glycosyltransferase involved in cell wall biosynthesis
MKVSIVTISYNQIDFLEECILSVLEQDYPNVEYIIVDPGSTDGSRETIKKYRDRIRHIIFEPDEGPADGLNKGFSRATGEVYAFLNADDILLDNAVSEFVKVFEKYDVDVVSGHGFIIDSSGKTVRPVFSDKFNLKNYVYGSCVLLQQSTFFKAHIYKEVGGFNKENKSCWDGELWFDMAINKAKFKRSNGYYSCFRIYPESITGSGRSQDGNNSAYFRHAMQLGYDDVGSTIKRKWSWLFARLFDPLISFKRMMARWS